MQSMNEDDKEMESDQTASYVSYVTAVIEK